MTCSESNPINWSKRRKRKDKKLLERGKVVAQRVGDSVLGQSLRGGSESYVGHNL